MEGDLHPAEGTGRPGGRVPGTEFVRKNLAGRGKSITRGADGTPVWALHELTSRFVLLEQRFYLFQGISTYCMWHPLVGIGGHTAAQV